MKEEKEKKSIEEKNNKKEELKKVKAKIQKEKKEKNDKFINEINSLKEALNLEHDKVLRTQAEMMNFKRRKEEEISYMLKYANEDILKALLPIVDNFERAIKLDDNDLSDDVSKFLSGIKMIYTSVIDVLNKFEVKEIIADGVEFDPKIHQAVLMEHDEAKPSGVVLEVLQKGYLYKDKVIRPAMVKVNE